MSDLRRLFGHGIGIHLLQSEDPSSLPKKKEINPKDNHISFQVNFQNLISLFVLSLRDWFDITIVYLIMQFFMISILMSCGGKVDHDIDMAWFMYHHNTYKKIRASQICRQRSLWKYCLIQNANKWKKTNFKKKNMFTQIFLSNSL